MRGLLYTFLIGNHDNLLPPPNQEGWDFICVTDKPRNVSGWKFVKLKKEDIGSENKRTAMTCMFNVFNYIEKEYDIIITMGANIYVQKNLKKLIIKNNILENDVVFLSHPDRQCVYEEIKELLKNHKEKININNVEKAKDFLLKNNYPANNGLFATGVMFINGKKNIVKEYFNEFKKDYKKAFSKRDQLTINYSLYKNSKHLSKLKYKTIPFKEIIVYQHMLKYGGNASFVCVPHIKGWK